ncbi:MAG: radical SAM protein [Planctomycetota bacterium]|jgi:hypothetical protein
MIQKNIKNEITIPPLIGGGIMLSYRCTNTCRHCLYCCSPRQPDEWMSIDMARKVFTALAAEPQLHSIHLAGGEATIHLDLLEEITQLATGMSIPIEYLETNAHWCTDYRRAITTLERLKQAGLPGLLVSASMFHNEFVPFKRTRMCVKVGYEIFGYSNVIVWLPETYKLLSQMPDDGVHTLEEFCQWSGIQDRLDLIPRLYQLIPGGRTCSALRNCYQPTPAQSFKGQTCRRELTNTTHFHIDLYGQLFTGLCAGLVAASVDNLHPQITQQTNPIFHKLCTEGPYDLMQWAADKYNYQPQPNYISKCDLCINVRQHLHQTNNFPELKPNGFYNT